MNKDEYVLVDSAALVDYIYDQMVGEELELREVIERVLQLEMEYLENIGLAVKVNEDEADTETDCTSCGSCDTPSCIPD
ncbi:hypothetical protein [Paenibacillus ehimensis]|uniref:Uncharacterized protein n=1 Tax=Paenibacillus ehimensis TaxID=79264 RepID=A0ABT8VHU0_9BACL|nr:hypothetical protein [Paenibacillus ehimensis]MDO3680554.1 hypothetical protein [Paenibacillus ehimensis]